ncbi:MAG: PilW family protein [Deltaproteobacteria bacterium]|nr:PilW family protein [Deltaproteobacteria bacterium]
MKTNKLPVGSPILNLGSGSAAFRIDDSNPKRPLLMMASSQAGGDPSQYDWQPVAEGVEDMQIAVQLDTSDPPDAIGDVWVNSRDLQTSELGKARAVRISLVFRSMSPATGWSSGRRPALEDRPAATSQDGYIRRVLTTMVKLRNVPTEAKP